MTECGHISYSWPGDSRILPLTDFRGLTNFLCFRWNSVIANIRIKENQLKRPLISICYWWISFLLVSFKIANSKSWWALARHTPSLDRNVEKRRYITPKVLKITAWFFFSVVDNFFKFCYKKRIKAPMLIYLL